MPNPSAAAEFGHNAVVPKNASITVRIKPPPAMKMGGAAGVTRSVVAATGGAVPRSQL